MVDTIRQKRVSCGREAPEKIWILLSKCDILLLIQSQIVYDPEIRTLCHILMRKNRLIFCEGKKRNWFQHFSTWTTREMVLENTSLSQCTETLKIFQQNDAGKLSLIPSFKNFLVPKWIYFENSQGVESIRKILRKFGTGSKLIRFGCGVTDVKFSRNRVHSVCSFRLLVRPPGGGKKIWRPACKISLTPPLLKVRKSLHCRNVDFSLLLVRAHALAFTFFLSPSHGWHRIREYRVTFELRRVGPYSVKNRK